MSSVLSTVYSEKIFLLNNRESLQIRKVWAILNLCMYNYLYLKAFIRFHETHANIVKKNNFSIFNYCLIITEIYLAYNNTL